MQAKPHGNRRTPPEPPGVTVCSIMRLFWALVVTTAAKTGNSIEMGKRGLAPPTGRSRWVTNGRSPASFTEDARWVAWAEESAEVLCSADLLRTRIPECAA